MSGPTEATRGDGETPQARRLPESCDQCGSADMRSELVRSAFWEGERLVVVEDIPAAVCGSCHERYYDDDTVMRLDLLRGGGFPPDRAVRQLNVPVFSLRRISRSG